MVNWKSPEEIANDGGTSFGCSAYSAFRIAHCISVAFSRFMHTLLGVYMYVQPPNLNICAPEYHVDAYIRRWEWFTSLPFDWQYLSGKKPFRWPLVRGRATAWIR